jgi:hypothetical protein
MSTGSEEAAVADAARSQLIAQLKYACDRQRHVRARSIPIAFGLEKTLLIQLEVEGATLLSRFVCARANPQLPPECASLCARCFNWALATRRAPRTRNQKDKARRASVWHAEQRPCK